MKTRNCFPILLVCWFAATAAADDAGLRDLSAAASQCAPQFFACNGGDHAAALGRNDCQSAHGRAFDLYSFGAHAGEMITVSLAANRFGGYLALVNPQGRIVETSEVTPGGNAFVALEAPEDGVYDVIASTSTAGGDGDYNVSVSCLPVEAADFTPCTGGDSLCLANGRFRVETWWQTPDGTTGRGVGRAISDDTGYFSYFQEGTAEVMFKALDGCSVNGHKWFFAGGLTDVHSAVRVTDTEAQETVWYFNPHRTPFRAVQDTTALATCN